MKIILSTTPNMTEAKNIAKILIEFSFGRGSRNESNKG